MSAMSLLDVEHAIDLGREALSYVRSCATPAPEFRKRDLLSWRRAAAKATARSEALPSGVVAGKAREKLDEFAQSIDVVTAGTRVRDLRPPSAATWGSDLYAAEGASRVPTCERIEAEVAAAIDRLGAIRTALVLGREIPGADDPE